MAKTTNKVKGTAKDGGETSPTPTKVGGEAIAKETKATQENDKMEISPKKRARSGGNHQFVNIARSRDTSAECFKIAHDVLKLRMLSSFSARISSSLLTVRVVVFP
jgi:hypothetical protein